MPVGRLSSSSRNDGHRYSAASDSVYREDRQNGMYRSSPDLAVPSYNHRRSSSTDSLDGSYRGSHSRQSSDSCDGYPTRNLINRRKSSAAADPLQFIKSTGAQVLAKQAEEQIKQVEEIKQIRTSVTESARDEDDWQSKLGDWKSRRKSQSQAFQIKEEMEEVAQQKEEDRMNKVNSAQKSYKQIQEERERRKSSGTIKSTYPFDEDDDEGDNDAFISPIKSSTVESSASGFSKITSSTPSSKITSSTPSSSKSKSDTAAWARDTDSESGSGDESDRETEDTNNNQPLDNKTKDVSDINQSKNEEHNTSHNIKNYNKDYSASDKSVSSRYSANVSDSKGVADRVSRENARNSEVSPSNNKINNIRHRFESPENKPVTRTAVCDAKVNLQERKKSFENFDKSNDFDVGKPPKPYPRERSSNHASMTSSMTSSTVYSSSKVSGKDYVEKNIKITSKHNSQGFGFTITGGADRNLPITVERVSLGSAADVCELKSKDEILLVDNRDMSRLSKHETNDLIQDAARRGQIEIRVKRFLDSDADELSDEFLSSDEDEENRNKDESREKTQSFDSNFSQEEEPSPVVSGYNNNISKNSSNISEDVATTYNYTDQPLMNQLKNDASLLMQLDPQNDSSYQSAENASQSYSSYASSRNASSLDNGDYVNTSQPSYVNTSASEPIHSERSDFVRKRDSHHDYVNTSNIDSWGYSGIHDDNQEPEVVMRRKKKVDESNNSSSSLDEIDRVKSPDVGSSDSDGPPAILRKWQRQRPKSEYKFQDEKPIINQKRLSATLPWQPEHRGIEDRPNDPVMERAMRDFEETVNGQPIPSPRINQFNQRADRKRIAEWNNQQEQVRQPDDVNANDVDYNQQAEFENNREQIQKQYEEEQKRAADIQQQKQQQEKELLEPEMQRMRLLEERKAERRKRLQELHQDRKESTAVPVTSSRPMEVTETRANLSYNRPQSHPYQNDSRPINTTISSHPMEIAETRTTMSYSSPQHHTYQNVYEPNYVNQPANNISSVNIQVADGRNLAPGQQPVDPNISPMSFTLPSSQSGRLYIDPRNRIDDSEPLPEYSIQLNLNQQETPQGLIIQPEMQNISAHETNFLEQEKENIRQEYLKFEATFRQQQEEEDRKFHEREEKLRQQAEQLKKEEERLRREEEKLDQERQNFLNKSAEFSKSHNEPKIHQPVPTRVRGQSALYKSTVSSPHRTEPKMTSFSTSMVVDNTRDNRHSVKRVDPTWPPSNKTRQPGNISLRKTNDQWPPGGKTNDAKLSNSANKLNKDWPPQDKRSVQSMKSRYDEPDRPKSFSREDMLAMNRKATPLQTKPDGLSGPTSPTALGPIKRETPTRQEIHSLNAVPKPKLRQSVDWIGTPEPTHERKSAQRRSDMMKNQYSDPLQGHWLIEEAERRRMNSDLNMNSASLPIQPVPFNGPIKPPRDPSNMWSDNISQSSNQQQQRIHPDMPMQIRQTLLSKTANARGSNGSSYSQELNSGVPQISRNPNLSQTMPSSHSYNSLRMEYGSHNPVSHAPPPSSNSSDQGPISGKQLCSSCHQELGFGAAMIIEKLGLYYHMPCFKCCVCRTPLGNGIDGADVRIRVNKLHCPDCYSNDEGI